jgi:uncharacterized membrane protein
VRSPASTLLWIFLGLLIASALASVFALVGRFELGIMGPLLFSTTVLAGLATVLAPMYTEVGKKAANLTIFSLLGIGLVSQLVGVHGGLPFGMFTYSEAWWPVFNLPTEMNFPVFAPVLWMLVAASCFMVVERAFKLESGITTAVFSGLLAGVLSIPIDLVLRGSLEMWQWASLDYPIGGPMFGMPFMSPIGWFLTSAVGGFVLAGYKAEEGVSFQAGAALWGLMSLLGLYASLERQVIGYVMLPVFVTLLVWTLLTRARVDEL